MFRFRRKTDADKALEVLVQSSRIGRLGGRPAMPFHCHVGSVKVGAGTGAVDYLAREGDYVDRDDLEHLAGDPDAVIEAAAEIDAGARIRRGSQAERVLITEVFELPAASTPAARKAVAEAVVTRWQDRGHEAVAAVHMPPAKADGRMNPHIHVAIAARPWKWDLVPGPTAPCLVRVRDRTVRLMVGKAAVQDERQAVAELVNQVMTDQGIEAPLFVGGRLVDVGITRKPQRRVPAARWHQGQHEPDPAAVEAARARHLAEAEEREERRKAKELERFQRLEARGLVTKRRAAAQIDWARHEERQAAKHQITQARRPRPLTEDQVAMLTDLHELQGRPLPDLSTVEGQSVAFAYARAALAAEKQARKARQKPQERQEAAQTQLPQPTPPQPPSGQKNGPRAGATPSAPVEPLRIDPAKMERPTYARDLRARLAGLDGPTLLETLRATVREHETAGRVAAFLLGKGAEALRAEVRRRGGAVLDEATMEGLVARPLGRGRTGGIKR